MTFDRNRTVHLIVNPHSGYGGQRLILPELRSGLTARGLAWCEYVTKAPRDATRRAREIADDAGAVIVWGGDGTVREVATGLAGSRVPILAARAGTENLLAKELQIPRRPDSLLDCLLHGRVMDCDVGTVNGRSFLMIIGVGFDGEVVRRLSTVRSGHISHLSYFWPIWRTFWEHDFPRMKITADGEEVFDDVGLAFIGNISRYAVGLRICRDARFDDGLLDLVVFSCREQTALVLHAAWTLLRRHPLKGNVTYRRARNIRIETPQPVATEADGDVGPSTPVDVSVSGERIRLIVPPSQPKWSLWPWVKGPTAE